MHPNNHWNYYGGDCICQLIYNGCGTWSATRDWVNTHSGTILKNVILMFRWKENLFFIVPGLLFSKCSPCGYCELEGHGDHSSDFLLILAWNRLLVAQVGRILSLALLRKPCKVSTGTVGRGLEGLSFGRE
jgi:hypothetical protein